MECLKAVADRQVVLSQTADALKKSVDRARGAVLVLSIVGAIAAGLTAALEVEGNIRTALAVAGAASLVLASGVAGFFLGTEARQRPILCRAGSERLKREAFLFASGAGDYGAADARDRLLAALGQVGDEMHALARFEVTGKGEGRCPRDRLDREAYIERRLDAQIDFYRDRLQRYRRNARLLHAGSWLLSLVASLITAVSAAVGPRGFDPAAITGILTTASAALLSHLQATKYDQLISAYAAAARALERLKAGLDEGESVASIADRTEAIVAEESGSWQALFLKDPAAPS